MEYVYHFTSREGWEGIRASGVLNPNTPNELYNPEDCAKLGIILSPRLRSIMKDESYFVAIPELNHSGWQEYQLLDDLKFEARKGVVLKVPVINRKGAFIREHAHFSPKKFLDKFGIDLMHSEKICLEVIENGRVLDRRFIDAVNEYYESTTALEDYKGDFKVPEVWIPQKTPLDKLEVVVNNTQVQEELTALSC